MNKKLFGIIGVVFLLVLLVVCCFINPDKQDNSSEDINTIIYNAQSESANVKENEKKDFIEISVDLYLSKYSEEEKSLVLIGRPTCHYCQIAEPILHNIAYKYNVDINYLNIDNFQNDDSQKLVSSDSSFSEGFGTPLLLVVGGGKIEGRVEGLTDTKHYISFMEKYGFIK